MKKHLIILLLAGVTLIAGCGNSDPNVVSGFQGNAVLAAPVCADDAYTTNQNAALTVNAANGVLANDAPNGGTAAFAATSAQGGTVSGNADGSFTYTPVANFNGTDNFTYTVTNAAGSVTCTVTITVNSINGFFVDSANGSDTNGSFTGGVPFQTIQAAVTAAGTNQDIVVLPGNYTGQIQLLNGQRLLGSGSTLVTPQGAVRPNLTGPVILANGNTLDFLRIANSPDDAIDGDDQNGGTITNCEIDTTTGNLGSGIQASNASGDWTISSNTITNCLGAGLDFRTSGTDTAVVRANNNQITNNDFNAIGFITSNSSDLAAQITGNTMTGNQTGFTFEVITDDTSTCCFDIENNTNDDTYRMSQTATTDLDVEQFSSLIAINNNSGTVTQSGGSVAPTEVPDGTCGF